MELSYNGGRPVRPGRKVEGIMKIDVNWVSCVEAADTAYCLEEPLLISGYELRNSPRAVALKVVRKGTPIVVRRGRGRPKKVRA